MSEDGNGNRYAVEFAEFDGVQHKAICRRDLGTRGNRLFMIRGLAKELKDLRRVDHPRNTVYMDGAARGPYYDKKRGIFSTDHHDGCIRQITDAACVQEMNLTRTRIIGAVGYRHVGNEPDLDTLFASWAGLNADLIAHDDRVFRRMLPLFLLEGNIDGLGLGYEELIGLAPDVIAEARERIHWLLHREQELKTTDHWKTIDFVDYTEEGLREIDKFALYRHKLDVPVAMTVHRKFPLRNGQQLHFVQAANTGIYEVENTITKHLGERDCACIIFYDGRSKLTVKLSGFVNDFDLVPVGIALDVKEMEGKQRQNVLDPAMLNAHWGGGSSIHGPPRYYNGAGSFLDNEVIIQTVVEELEKQITA
ncbi:MAG: hypothetical protein Greene041619_357 [Candidatus Peregrinibacteria bacterium Greene0416_19]|nr:MAG: hypothetical protein Greene041619_357 [Candidatus Peregrinibacteria bacterium Greene0416_19]